MIVSFRRQANYLSISKITVDFFFSSRDENVDVAFSKVLECIEQSTATIVVTEDRCGQLHFWLLVCSPLYRCRASRSPRLALQLNKICRPFCYLVREHNSPNFDSKDEPIFA